MLYKLDKNGYIYLSINAQNPHKCDVVINQNSTKIKALQRVKTNLQSICQSSITENNRLQISFNGTTFLDISLDEININTSEEEKILVCSEFLTTNEIRDLSKRKLSQEELSNFKFERKFLKSFDEEEVGLTTDLHTHFTMALSDESLIRVAQKHNLSIPTDFLSSLKIDIHSYNIENGNILINDLKKEDLQAFRASLSLSPFGNGNFDNLRRANRARNILTENPKYFLDYIQELCDDYKKQGIKNVELSLTNLGVPRQAEKYVELINSTEFEKIVKSSHVDIRFLAGYHRDVACGNTVEHLIKAIKSTLPILQNCTRIVGCDILGEELSSLEDIKPCIDTLIEHAYSYNPSFVIRVHAGETNSQSSAIKENVKSLLKMINAKYEDIKKTKKDYILPNIRIGHAINGIDSNDQELMRLIQKVKPIIELNPTSNNATGNIQNIRNSPYKKIIDLGLNCIVGTDGHGMYHTTSKEEMISLIEAGLTVEDLIKIFQLEKKICDDPINYEKKIRNAITYLEKIRKDKFFSELETFKVNHNESEINAATEGKMPILISGSSRNHWAILSKDEKEYIATFAVFASYLFDPQKVYFITGGTDYGVEMMFHHNTKNNNTPFVNYKDGDFDILGLFTEEAYNKNIAETAKAIASLDFIAMKQEKKQQKSSRFISEKIDSEELKYLIYIQRLSEETGTSFFEKKLDIINIQPKTINMALVRGKTWKDIATTQLEYLNDQTHHKRGLLLSIGGGEFVKKLLNAAIDGVESRNI